MVIHIKILQTEKLLEIQPVRPTQVGGKVLSEKNGYRSVKTSLLLSNVIDAYSRGGDSIIKMPEYVCWESENVPILKDALGKKKHTHIEGFLCILHTHFMV